MCIYINPECLRYHVCTTPASVADLAMADVKQTEVTVKWSPPKSLSDDRVAVKGLCLWLLAVKRVFKGIA